MSRALKYSLLIVGLALLLAALAGAVYLTRSTWVSSFPQAKPVPRPALSWLPAESGLVASIDVAAMRQQAWLAQLIHESTGEVSEAPDYRAFVEGTGFDYARDLDHVWLGVYGSSQQPFVTGVAEGRFARARILNYARQQGGVLHTHRGFDIYEISTVAPAAGQPPGRFAFAFLDPTHLVFGSDAQRAAAGVDCWLNLAPAVASDLRRRSEIERASAGRQAWAYDDLSRWVPPALSGTEKGEGFDATIAELALGLTVKAEGIELAAEARCHQAEQAKRLSDNLGILLLAGRMALSREKSPAGQALARTLSDLKLAHQDDRLEARVLVPPRALEALLRAAPRAAKTQ